MGSINTHTTHRTASTVRRRTLAALAVTSTLALTACGSDDDAANIAREEADVGEAIAGDGAEAPVAPATGGIEPGGVASAGLPVAIEARDIITSVDLTMATSDVRQTAADIRDVTTSGGGYIFSSDVVLEDERPDGSVPGGGQMVIKIPPRDLDPLIARLDGIGVVTRLAQDAEDVTDQLVDLDIRIRQAEAGIARIELLLAEATELDDVFKIENELNERTVDLERLRATQRNTESLVDLATLTVQVEYRTPAALADTDEPADGIADAFSNGWNAFIGAVFALGYVLAVLAPFLVTLLVVGLVAAALTRRWNRRRAEAREARRQAADLDGASLARTTLPAPADVHATATPTGSTITADAATAASDDDA